MSSSIFADLLTNNYNHYTHTPRSSLSSDQDNDLSTLPFPQPLSRPTFSSPTFNTETFLLSHAQFRTLDDLRSELRTWVDKLSNEMEMLIEEDWQGYLSLGRGLTGGEVGVRDAERRVRMVEREVLVLHTLGDLG
jgi:conserved oligomeric Golgi complex subunit 2